MSAAVAKLDAEIAAIRAEISSVERAPATIPERALAENELRRAEEFYRTHGLAVGAGLQNALLVVNRDALLKLEHQRLTDQGEGLSAADRARRVEELRRQILRASARRELLIRHREGDDFLPRPTHPELLIFTRAEVERLAA